MNNSNILVPHEALFLNHPIFILELSIKLYEKTYEAISGALNMDLYSQM